MLARNTSSIAPQNATTNRTTGHRRLRRARAARHAGEAADEAEFESDVEPHVSRSPAASSAGTERLYGSSTSTSPTSDIGDSPNHLGVASPVSLPTELAT